jgi:two-component system response regulator HydG
MASEQASELELVSNEPWHGNGDDGLVGRSGAVREIRAQIAAAAEAPSTVLISGETGTGKGVVARAIHARSLRAACPFVHLDCASVSEGTFESELFGHERGAFTDARERHVGRLESAGTGTLFLDEIGELGARLQAKLLRTLQDRAFERVGGNATLDLEARVIAATNRDLLAAVQRGAFRSDLYYRLDVLRIHVPPLRERLEDLPQLVDAGIARSSRALGRPVPHVSESFLARLRQHAWPGNVRELFNVLERCVARVAVRELSALHLDGTIHRTAGTEPATSSAASGLDRERILGALRDTGGNVSRAARRLGVSRSTLRYRIERHGLRPWVPRD